MKTFFALFYLYQINVWHPALVEIWGRKVEFDYFILFIYSIIIIFIYSFIFCIFYTCSFLHVSSFSSLCIYDFTFLIIL